MRIRDLIPSYFVNMYRRLNYRNELYYFDSFQTWDDASNRAYEYGEGYESKEILDNVIAAIQEVRQGKATYEQDGVAFYAEKNQYELLASLFYVVCKDSSLRIMDIGGGLGSTFYRYRHLLDSNSTSWSIVEQRQYVDYGKKNIPEVSFYYSVEECYEREKNNCVLLSGVLPYLDDPTKYLESIFEGNPRYIILARTVCDDREAYNRIMLQYVPETINKAVYPSWIFNSEVLKGYFTEAGYRKVFEWTHRGVPIITRLGFEPTEYRGYLFELD